MCVYIYMHAKRSHAHVKDPLVHVRVRWIMETPKITQHALKVSSFQNVETGHYTKEDEERNCLTSR